MPDGIKRRIVFAPLITGVTGIVTAVEANDAVDALGEPVDNLALAFVTPLGTDYHDIFRHWDSFHPEFRGP